MSHAVADRMISGAGLTCIRASFAYFLDLTFPIKHVVKTTSQVSCNFPNFRIEPHPARHSRPSLKHSGRTSMSNSNHIAAHYKAEGVECGICGRPVMRKHLARHVQTHEGSPTVLVSLHSFVVACFAVAFL